MAARSLTLDEVKSRTRNGTTFEVLAPTTLQVQIGSRLKVNAVHTDLVAVERSDNGGWNSLRWPQSAAFRAIAAGAFEYDVASGSEVPATIRLRILPGLTCIHHDCWNAVADEEDPWPYCHAHAAEFRREQDGATS
jgi:hypothetical protein